MRRLTAAVGSTVFFVVGPRRLRRPEPLVADGLAGTGTHTVPGDRAGARGGSARRRADRDGPGVHALRGGGSRDTGTNGRARSPDRRRAVPPRSQSHVRGGSGDHRWSGSGPWTDDTVGLRRGRVAGGRLVRPLVRRTRVEPQVRGTVQSLPVRRAGLVAPPAPVESRRARRIGRTMTQERPATNRAREPHRLHLK